MVKLAIFGKMCSGKTTIANNLIEINNQFVKLSFADKVKDIAKELFNMEDKDRKLLQMIGTKMREIDEDVWAKYIIEKANSFEYVIIDDLRFINEFKALKKNDFKIIKLKISEELQKKRLQSEYPFTWRNHIENIQHQSETEIELIDDYEIDLIIDIDKNEENILEIINNFLKPFQK